MVSPPVTAEELDDVAKRAAGALVRSFATDASGVARTGLARLFTGEPPADAVALALFDADNRLVSNADLPDRGQAREALRPAWRLRLTTLLRDDPGRAAEVKEVLAAVSELLPNVRPVHEQHNTAHGSSTIYAAMYGNVHHHQGVSGRVAPAPDGTDPVPEGPRGGAA